MAHGINYCLRCWWYVQLILGNILHNPESRAISVKTAVDLALEGADYTIEKLFPLPTAEKKEDAK